MQWFPFALFTKRPSFTTLSSTNRDLVGSLLSIIAALVVIYRYLFVLERRCRLALLVTSLAG
jgi:hypothetical protein